jgi:hypothetical protein
MRLTHRVSAAGNSRLAPVGKPLIINVQFVSAVDKSSVGSFQVRVDRGPGLAKSGQARKTVNQSP